MVTTAAVQHVSAWLFVIRGLKYKYSINMNPTFCSLTGLVVFNNERWMDGWMQRSLKNGAPGGAEDLTQSNKQSTFISS